MLKEPAPSPWVEYVLGMDPTEGKQYLVDMPVLTYRLKHNMDTKAIVIELLDKGYMCEKPTFYQVIAEECMFVQLLYAEGQNSIEAELQVSLLLSNPGSDDLGSLYDMAETLGIAHPMPEGWLPEYWEESLERQWHIDAKDISLKAHLAQEEIRFRKGYVMDMPPAPNTAWGSAYIKHAAKDNTAHVCSFKAGYAAAIRNTNKQMFDRRVIWRGPEDTAKFDELTCADCVRVVNCKYAFDQYNNNGDCLEDK